MHWIKLCGICQKKRFCLWTFLASFFRIIAYFTETDSLKIFFWIQPESGFYGPQSEPVKLPSPLIGILSDFSSSWKVPNVRLWLFQGHNLNTIVYYTLKSAMFSNTIYPHKCFIQCNAAYILLPLTFPTKFYEKDNKCWNILLA